MPRKPVSQAVQASGSAAAVDRLSDEQIGRLAEMIADGRTTMPDELGSAAQERLQAEARRQLRERLVRHIARAIAHHLRCTAGHGPEVSPHD